jgi:KTSC domain
MNSPPCGLPDMPLRASPSRLLPHAHPVESSVLASLAYDETQSILQVEFHNGAIYHYFGVSLPDFHALLQADSKGNHFNRHIRLRFPHRKLRAAVETPS